MYLIALQKCFNFFVMLNFKLKVPKSPRMPRIGSQPVSKPVEQEVEFLRMLKEGYLSYENLQQTSIKNWLAKALSMGTHFLKGSLKVWAKN